MGIDVVDDPTFGGDFKRDFGVLENGEGARL